MLNLSPAIASAVPELYRDARIVDYAGVAATAWLLYDICITFVDEVEHVWRTPWSVPKTCFFFSRYASLVIQFINLGASTKWMVLKDDNALNNNLCTGVSLFKVITSLFIGMSVEIIMLLRVHALYGKKRCILIFLTTIYIIELAVVTTMLAVTIHQVLVSKSPVLLDEIPTDSPLTGCYPISVPVYFCVYWTAMIVFQSVLFFMMSTNMLRVGFSGRGLGGIAKTPLLTIFLRDGTIFYAMHVKLNVVPLFVMLNLIEAALLTNLILFKILNSPISQFAVCLHLTVLSVSCSRLILNLRTLSRDPSPDSTCEPFLTIGTIHFMRTVPQNTVDITADIELQNTQTTGYNDGGATNDAESFISIQQRLSEDLR
ncbi:hypothetical protein SCHPADRAFT_51688 [Schizopora paradoxa]|uniref:DUF6533 domain-containing protein n=1 Tax=Schizopora paradoxa TaxID=27342 RepID=A0A0H2SCZ8_9AGAM|nr:hypothetical protein SCHPADRAFT_51688 [Schizopora paradoxa]